MALCAAKLSQAPALRLSSYFAHVKTDVEARKTIRHYGLFYLINREKLHQPITYTFAARIYSEYSDQMFISGDMVFKWL